MKDPDPGAANPVYGFEAETELQPPVAEHYLPHDQGNVSGVQVQQLCKIDLSQARARHFHMSNPPSW